MIRRIASAGLLALSLGSGQVGAATLWSVPESHLGTGHFYGPGAFPQPTELFPVMLRGLAFTSDRDFVTPFWNNGGAPPNTSAEQHFPPVDGLLSDGTKINENADLGAFTLAGTRFLPAVAEGGRFVGQQLAVAQQDGNMVMVMDLVLDLGIGERGVIRMPFYGTTGTVKVPEPLAAGAREIPRQAGRLKSGERVSGRIGDFNADGFIDGTLVAVGVMPADSPVYPGQPWAMVRNFETDIPIGGDVWGSAVKVDAAYKALE